MWHSARASTGSDRSRLHPPSLVSVALSARIRLSCVESDLPRRVERVPLAGHRDVLGAVEPQQHRPPGERRAQCGDRGEAVRLHLLAAEPAAHPQALHRDLVAVQAQHVRDDLLGLRRVLGAGLHEQLPGLVDQRQRGVGLQVEVLLPAELELPAEPMGARGQPGSSASPRLTVRAWPWKLSAAMASPIVISDGSGSYSTTIASAPCRAASTDSPST